MVLATASVVPGAQGVAGDAEVAEARCRGAVADEVADDAGADAVARDRAGRWRAVT